MVWSRSFLVAFLLAFPIVLIIAPFIIRITCKWFQKKDTREYGVH